MSNLPAIYAQGLVIHAPDAPSSTYDELEWGNWERPLDVREGPLSWRNQINTNMERIVAERLALLERLERARLEGRMGYLSPISIGTGDPSVSQLW